MTIYSLTNNSIWIPWTRNIDAFNERELSIFPYWCISLRLDGNVTDLHGRTLKHNDSGSLHLDYDIVPRLKQSASLTKQATHFMMSHIKRTDKKNNASF